MFLLNTSLSSLVYEKKIFFFDISANLDDLALSDNLLLLQESISLITLFQGCST